MKRVFTITLSAILALFCALLCAACGGEGGDTSEPREIDVLSEAQGILSRYDLSGGTLYTPDGEDELDDDLILSYFGDATSVPDFSFVETYALYIDETKPISPCEFGIFKMKAGGGAEAFKAFLDARIQMKLRNAALYPDMDTTALTTAKVTVMGDYVWYCAVKGANAEIDSALRGE